MKSQLLTRDEFREGVFKRDNYKCVVCGNPAQDSHHILERRLFNDGGYYLDNGCSLCGEHHITAEKTLISPQELRDKAGIKKVILPEHFYEDEVYDKWGNIVLPNGQRLKGELFHDESVQKILSEVLGQFTHYVKYPRTYHLPFSLNHNKDDKNHETTNQWSDKEVIITLKMDGENTTMYSDHIHARSLSSNNHPSRNWVKNYWSSIAHNIPEGWRIVGENLFAKHSIHYNNLPSYFLGFSIWNEKNFCLSWDETLEYFELMGILPVATLYRGKYDEKLIKSIKLDYEFQEGYVLRTTDGFSYGEFRKYVGKFVRPNHVQTSQHWIKSEIVPNVLESTDISVDE